jgi:hypothetical protein
MVIRSPERALEVINVFMARHPELVNDDHNAMALGNWIKKYNSPLDGDLVFTDASLELAYQMLATSGSLHFYASPETTTMVAQGNQKAAQLAAQLAAEKAEKDRQATTERKRLENIARLETQGSRGNHGFATADDIEKENARIQRQETERRKAATRVQRHEQFISELAAANQYLVTNISGVKWGATNDARKQMKEALKRKFPEFASEAV